MTSIFKLLVIKGKTNEQNTPHHKQTKNPNALLKIDSRRKC